MARCLWFYFAFDPSAVRQGAEALALGQPLSEEWLVYFRQCPNNAPLTVILSLVYRLGKKLGLAEPYVLEVYGAALLTNLSVATAMAAAQGASLCSAGRFWAGGGMAAVFAIYHHALHGHLCLSVSRAGAADPVDGLESAGALRSGGAVLLIGRGGEAQRLYPADRCWVRSASFSARKTPPFGNGVCASLPPLSWAFCPVWRWKKAPSSC